MSAKTPRNLPASIRQRLLDRARRDARPFNELLQYYAMERFLYRLSRSGHADHFILKGALMLRVWQSPQSRPTMDIDMLARTNNDEARIADQISEVLAVDIEPDGLVFERDSVRTERITQDADYEGVRVRFRGVLDSARVNLQIDIGFGDEVYPEPEPADLPTLLDAPAPRLLCYSRESAIAEKFEAMVKLGAVNSRMKDFYDIWALSRQFDFEGDTLCEAISRTFRRRGTTIPDVIVALQNEFGTAKQGQWAAFRNRVPHEDIPVSFAHVVADLDEFLAPLISALSVAAPAPPRWTAPGPWRQQA